MSNEDDGNETTPRQEVTDAITVSLGAVKGIGKIRDAFREIEEDRARQFEAIQASLSGLLEMQDFEWEAVRKRVTRMAEWGEQFRQRIQEALPSEEEWERSVEVQAKRAEKLADAGWTLPMDATAPEVRWIVEEAEGDVGEVMAAAFREWGLLPKIEKRLSKSAVLDPWRPLVDECFQSYRDGRYAITIPSLLAMMEGVVIGTLEGRSSRTYDVPAVLTQYVDSFEKWRFRRVPGMSVVKFVDHLFDFHDFSAPRPTLINRPWILHGRDLPSEWEEVDALRLFNALDTVVAILPEPEDE